MTLFSNSYPQTIRAASIQKMEQQARSVNRSQPIAPTTSSTAAAAPAVIRSGDNIKLTALVQNNGGNSSLAVMASFTNSQNHKKDCNYHHP